MTGRVTEGYPRGSFEMQTPSGNSWVSSTLDARDGTGVRWDINDFLDYGIGFWGEKHDGTESGTERRGAGTGDLLGDNIPIRIVDLSRTAEMIGSGEPDDAYLAGASHSRRSMNRLSS